MGGLVHYYNPILEALDGLPGYSLASLTPDIGSSSLGKGVYTENGNLKFETFFLPEKKGLFGKPFFKGFIPLLKNYGPDIIIAGWPYSLEILLNPFIPKKGIQVIHKDIPFNLSNYDDALQDYRTGKIIVSENYDHSNAKNPLKTLSYWLVTQLRKRFLSKASALVCYTTDALKIFPSYGVNKESIFIIYNSPDTKKLLAASDSAKDLPNKLAPNPFRMIHVGRLVKWKKVDLVLQAMAKLKPNFPDIEFLVVGNGPEKDTWEQLASDLGLAGQVNFLGAIYDPIDLAKYHQESAFYILGGIGGLSINEAMCFGKAVICSEADGTEKMLVRDGKNGLFFKSDDVHDLADKIQLLLESAEKCFDYGKESERIIKEEINETKVVEGYKNAFDYLTKLETA